MAVSSCDATSVATVGDVLGRDLLACDVLACDVLVVGGGVIGAATARALASGGASGGASGEISGKAIGGASREPRDVVLVDAGRPGHRRGGSHGESRIVRLTYPEPVYQAMARRAFTAWTELEREVGETFLVTTGSWECGPMHSPPLDELAAGLEAAQIPFRRLNADESRRRFPQLELPLGSQAIYQADGAVIHAERAVRALWRSAEAAGATTIPELRIVELTVDGSVTARGVRRRADGGEHPVTIRAERLVVAAGAWSAQLLAPLGVTLPLRVTREVVAYFPVSHRTAAWGDDHRIGSLPTVIDYHEERPFYALPLFEMPRSEMPRSEVPVVKVGWHRSGPTTDPRVDAVPDAAVLQRIVGYVGDRFPYLDLRPHRVTTCLYANTPDYHFVLDRHPRRSHVVVGAGFSGHGFKFAPVVGEILADLATDRNPTVDLDLFRLERFERLELAPRRSA